MSFGWVAGAVRGRSLARRRLGDEGVATLAAKTSLDDAVAFLAASSYGHRIQRGTDGVVARRAIAETSLWHLRVLAGWLPPRGVQSVRAVAGWFEVLDIENHASAIASGDRWREPLFPPGALATIWPRVAPTTTLRELRVVLAHSAWGDPGGDHLSDILLGLRLGWARVLRNVVPAARAWGDGALTLALAKALFAESARGETRKMPEVPELGVAWRRATDLTAFAAAVPDSDRWVLHGVRQFSDLWQAERAWWVRVDREAAQLLRARQLGRTAVIAAAMLLVTDSWRTLAAFEQAARGTRQEGVHARA
jgi:hypothetical protein